jgi:hypothetical protein
LADAVIAALKDSPPVLVIDLTTVTFFSSACLSVLVEAHQRGGRARTCASWPDGPPDAVSGSPDAVQVEDLHIGSHRIF